MTRHAKNSTAGSVYTYHEKQKDAKTSKYGSERARLGKESITNFGELNSIENFHSELQSHDFPILDCCNLNLQPARNPVLTKDGYLFDKEAILQYIITKKKEYSRKMKEFEKQKDSDAKELQQIAENENNRKIDIFKKTEKSIKIPSTSTSSGSSSLSNMSGIHAKLNPSFWLPSQTPDSGKAKIQKPDKTIYCPITGNVLKLKDLIDVKFTRGVKDEGTSKNPNDPQYVCAVTKDVLTNSQQLAVLRTTGDVVTMDCVEKIIKKDWIHPLTSEKITEKDVIVVSWESSFNN